MVCLDPGPGFRYTFPMTKFYEYSKCSTCRNAKKFLDRNSVKYQAIPIVERPPTRAELKRMLGHLGDFKKLFNTSGELYRELKISDRLKAGMTESEALELLSRNGKLIKRPFLLFDKGGTVGFKEDVWKKLPL